MQFTRSLIPGLVAGTLLLGNVSGTFAAAGKHASRPAQGTANGVFAVGKVSNVQTGSFQLTFTPRAPKGSTTTPAPQTITVTVSSTTKETARPGTTGPLTNGEYAAVFGTKTTNGIAATTVQYSTTAPTGGAHRGHAGNYAIGTVNLSKTNATTLVLTTRGGQSVSFTLNSATKYVVNGATSTTAPTFTNGESVAVQYIVNATTKAMTATTVVAPATRAAHAGNHATGTVDLSKTNGTTLVITTKAGKSLSFTLNSATKYIVNGAVATTAPTFTNGETVAVQYTVNASTKAMTATTVVAPATQVARSRNHAVGTVNLSQSNASTLVITTKAGKSLSFALNSATKYFVNGAAATTRPTFTNGETVGVQYTVNATTKAMTAVAVVVGTPKA